MTGAFSSRVFVGRQRELGELRAAFERAAGGASAAMLVGGEAGVGKTRLLAELGAAARRDGALVLTGLCADLRDAAMPLLPIAEALAALGPLPGRASADLEEAGRGIAPGCRGLRARSRPAAGGGRLGHRAAGDRRRPLGRSFDAGPADLPACAGSRRAAAARADLSQ